MEGNGQCPILLTWTRGNMYWPTAAIQWILASNTIFFKSLTATSPIFSRKEAAREEHSKHHFGLSCVLAYMGYILSTLAPTWANELQWRVTAEWSTDILKAALPCVGRIGSR